MRQCAQLTANNPKTTEYLELIITWEIENSDLFKKRKRVRFPFQRHFKEDILFYNDLYSVFFPTFFEPKIVHREYSQSRLF